MNLSKTECTEWDWVKICGSERIRMKLHEAEQVCETAWIWMRLSKSEWDFNLSEIGWIRVRLSECEWDRANLKKSEWNWVSVWGSDARQANPHPSHQSPIQLQLGLSVVVAIIKSAASAASPESEWTIWSQNGQSGIRMVNPESEWSIQNQNGQFSVRMVIQNGQSRIRMIHSELMTFMLLLPC